MFILLVMLILYIYYDLLQYLQEKGMLQIFVHAAQGLQLCSLSDKMTYNSHSTFQVLHYELQTEIWKKESSMIYLLLVRFILPHTEQSWQVFKPFHYMENGGWVWDTKNSLL